PDCGSSALDVLDAGSAAAAGGASDCHRNARMNDKVAAQAAAPGAGPPGNRTASPTRLPDAATVRRTAESSRVVYTGAVEKAQSGDRGRPVGVAGIAVGLGAGGHEHSPPHPSWFDRDRFVLANGHGSMLLYSLLHLTGYDLPGEG